MPYSEKQLKLFGIALSMMNGKTPYSYSKQAAEIARNTSKAELERMIGEGKS